MDGAVLPRPFTNTYMFKDAWQGRIQEFWLGGGVKVAGRGPDQPTSKTYILKSFFLQIRLLLDTLNLDF